MSVYSQSFIVMENVTSVSSPIEAEAVPANNVGVVRDISVTVTAEGSVAVYFSLYESTGDTIATFADLVQTDAPAGTQYHWEGRVVLEAGQQVRVDISSGQISGCISGYLLTNY